MRQGTGWAAKCHAQRITRVPGHASHRSHINPVHTHLHAPPHAQVRSLVLDTWLPGQVALMEAAGGNAAANAVLEAQLPPGVRPPR